MTVELTTPDSPQRTIRMFPDYTDTVLWINIPIDYEDTELSGQLGAVLEASEQSYYDSLDSAFVWVSDTAARTFTEEGVRLARWVSAEVGPKFVVKPRVS
ncbi:hypothetical protein ACQE2J_11265 [Brevibacterium sp. LE-L]|uniref:hypothetical protein n=1 Tax=unclassified Brevibacterium TaxID=2614124 RepID=UPI003CF41469